MWWWIVIYSKGQTTNKTSITEEDKQSEFVHQTYMCFLFDQKNPTEKSLAFDLNGNFWEGTAGYKKNHPKPYIKFKCLVSNFS